MREGWIILDETRDGNHSSRNTPIHRVESCCSSISDSQVHSNIDNLKHEIEHVKKMLHNETETRQNSQHKPIAASRLNVLQLKLRDIAEGIPKFNGHNMPIFQFLCACKRV